MSHRFKKGDLVRYEVAKDPHAYSPNVQLVDGGTYQVSEAYTSDSGADFVMIDRVGSVFAARFQPLNPETFELNTTDPFEAAVARLVQLNRRKRADYALDTDPWSNFRRTAIRSGLDGPIDAVMFNIHQKIVRLEALKANGRTPSNEAVEDTYDDMAVYSIIAGILSREENSTGPQS